MVAWISDIMSGSDTHRLHLYGLLYCAHNMMQPKNIGDFRCDVDLACACNGLFENVMKLAVMELGMELVKETKH